MMGKTEMRTVDAEVDAKMEFFLVMIGQVEIIAQLCVPGEGNGKQNNQDVYYFSPQ